MIACTKARITTGTALLLSLNFAAYAQHGDVVAAAGSRLVLLRGNNPAEFLGDDGIAKYLPCWSPNGHLVASLEVEDRSIALARVAVWDVSTKAPVATWLVHPTSGDGSNSGLRWITGIQWAGDSSVVVSGPLNPSTREYVRFGLDRRNPIDDFDADGFQVAFSSDGRHVAAVEGSVHWELNPVSPPQLLVDQRNSTAQLRHSGFTSVPAWSADGQQVAIVVRGADPSSAAVLAISMNGQRALLPIPTEPGAQLRLLWLGTQLVLGSGDVLHKWRIIRSVDPERDLVSSDHEKERQARALLSMAARSREAALRLGYRDPNVWLGAGPTYNFPESEDD